MWDSEIGIKRAPSRCEGHGNGGSQEEEGPGVRMGEGIQVIKNHSLLVHAGGTLATVSSP